MPIPKPKLFLTDYLTTAFIETGSHRGDGIQHALDAGFACVYSVDVSPFSYGWCSHRFHTQRNRVDLYLNDSRTFLRELLPRITTQCTFWLDAHWCGGNNEMGGKDGGVENDVPLMEELQIISGHDIKDHTILIDDVCLFGSTGYPTQEEVLAALDAINCNYILTFRDSAEHPEDILVAQIIPTEPTV